MDIDLLHPEHAGYPETDVDWQAAQVYPIGVVQIDDGEDYCPLAIAQQGRNRALFAIVGGVPVELDLAEAGPAFYAALDEACTDLWGHSWNAAMGEIFGLNRRTLQRDRVERYLLPPRVVMTVSYVHSADDASQLANLLVAINRYASWDGTNGDRSIVEGYMREGLKLYYEEDDIATLCLKF